MNNYLDGAKENWVRAAAYVAAAGAGAGMMYLMDPHRGTARRAQLQNRALKLARRGGTKLDKRIRDLEHRAEGILADLRREFEPEQPATDRKLEARVHTNLGRVATNPHAIRVMSLSGQVVVGGTAPADEIEKVVEAVAATPGVKGVENRLVAKEEPPAPRPAGPLVPTLLGVGTGVLAAVRTWAR